jgi:hypothetical protein
MYAVLIAMYDESFISQPAFNLHIFTVNPSLKTFAGFHVLMFHLPNHQIKTHSCFARIRVLQKKKVGKSVCRDMFRVY